MEDKTKEISTVDSSDVRNYSIIVEATYRTGKEDNETMKQTLNVFAKTPEEAFSCLLNLRQLYDDNHIEKINLVGVYKRTTLKVVEGED